MFLQWLRRCSVFLNDYRDLETRWPQLITSLHSNVDDRFPQLWGRVPRSCIKGCLEKYCDEFPFITGTLASRGFVEAMILADTRQILMDDTKFDIIQITEKECTLLPYFE